MTEADKSLHFQDFIVPFDFESYHTDKKEGLGECLPDNPGTSQPSDVNSANQNLLGFKVEELDEFITNEVGVIHTSDESTDDLSSGDESETDETECADTGSIIIGKGYTDASEYPLELDDLFDLDKGSLELTQLRSAYSASIKLKEKLSEALEKIKNALNDKKICMKEFNEVKDARNTVRPLLPTKSLFLAPYFAEPGPIGMFPPSNEDTIAKRRNNDITAYLHPSKEWSKYEKSRLRQGVFQVALDYVLKPLTIRHEFLKAKIAEQRKEGTLKKYEEREMKDEMQRLKFHMRQKRNQTDEETIKEAGDNIDWMQVSAQFFEGRRSELDCELMWKNYWSFSINKKPFTETEDRKLKNLVKKYNAKNWDLIAEELQTGRTAVQCCSRYQSHLNTNMVKRGPFTLEESDKIMKVIEEVRVGNYIPWQTVQLYIDGRRNFQISQHYKLVLKETLDRSPWTKEEDALILACVKKLGPKKWTNIQRYLPHRTDRKIYKRYMWFLNPIMKIGPWTDEENFKLMELVKKYGFGKWTAISKQLPGRPIGVLYHQTSRLLTKDKETNEVRFKSPEEIREMSICINRLQMACHQRRKDIIDSAYKALKSALEKIYYYLKTPITLENLSSISFPALRMLQKELMRRKNTSLRWNLDMKWKTKFPDSKPDICADEITSQDEAENVKEVESNWMNPEIIVSRSYTGVKEKELEDEEKGWLLKVLQSQIEEEANREPIPKYISGMIDYLGLYSTKEYLIYEEYLKQQLTSCKAECKEEDDNLCIMNGRDMKSSLPQVINKFVHPPATKDQVLVLPPNLTTLDALNGILESDSKLRRTAILTNHSATYLRYLLNRTKKKPKCLRCSQTGNCETCRENYEAAVNSMKSHLVIPTTEMKKSAMVETLFPAFQTKECLCDELLESKATVDLLTKRFIALFLWPTFLESIEPTEVQTELLNRRKTYKYKRKRNQNFRRKMTFLRDAKGCFKKRRIDDDKDETEEETESSDSDAPSCSSATKAVQHQIPAAKNEPEVIWLSDTPENFPYAEPME